MSENARRDKNRVPAILGFDEAGNQLKMVRVSSDGRLLVSTGGGGSSDSYSEVVSGKVAVGSTTVQLPSVSADAFVIQADIFNDAVIELGGADVGSSGGIELDAGGSFQLPQGVNDLSIFYAYAPGAGSTQYLRYIGFKE